MFVIVHTGIEPCGTASTMLSQFSRVVVKPSAGASTTVYVPGSSSSTFSPLSVKRVGSPPLTEKLKVLSSASEPTTTFFTFNFGFVGGAVSDPFGSKQNQT